MRRLSIQLVALTILCLGVAMPVEKSLADSTSDIFFSGYVDSAGQSSSLCKLTQAKTVQCFGQNDLGQLGNGTTNWSYTADQATLVSGLKNIKKISKAGFISCALDFDGAVFCWGGSSSKDLIPRPISGLPKATDISVGDSDENVCATSDEGVYCWAQRVGESTLYGTAQAPLKPTKIAGTEDVRTVNLSGWGSACGLTVSQKVKCWGGNYNREGGSMSCQDYCPAHEVPGLESVVKVGMYGVNACALNVNQQLWCWGQAYWGQLGSRQGSSDGSMPVLTSTGTKDFSVGFVVICGLQLNLDLWCSGYGIGNKTNVKTLGLGLTQLSRFQDIDLCLVVDESSFLCPVGFEAGNYGLRKLPTKNIIRFPESFATLKTIGDPSVIGSSKLGNSLFVDAGAWDSGVQITYQWLRDGVFIPGANSANYLLTSEDFQAKISVRITGTMTGYLPATRTSDEYLVAAGSLTQADFPKIVGDSVPLGILNASAGTWDSDVSFVYQWLVNGVEIPGANSPQYVLGVKEVGKNISVKLTGSKYGYVPLSRMSSESLINAGSLSQKPSPYISGKAEISNWLTAIPSTWDSGTTLNYQWLRDGVAIPAATSGSYTLQPSDHLKKISVSVTGSKEGYISETKTSESVTPVKEKDKIASLAFTGSSKVGAKAFVSPVNRNSKFDYSYQWLRNGEEIAGANSRTYLFGSEDVGSTVSARVCALYLKDVTHCVTQGIGSVVQLGVIKNVRSSFSGVSKVGRLLSASPATSDGQTSVSYQWLRDGNPIVDATKNTYFVDSLDKGSSISLRVTVSKPGYETVSKTSTSKFMN